MNDYSFGNFLCMLREKNGMTQADVANSLGVTPAAVSKWENGSSKPRVEVLFHLAQILGVRAEELMCGHYIQQETLKPDVLKQINERYTYLMKVDSFNTVEVKLRRLLAWSIDWNIIGLTVMLFTLAVSAVLLEGFKADSQIVPLITMFIILLFPTGFILRDLIFGGRSLGKRIMGLMVLDRQTGMKASTGKCALRNIFLFIVHIDAIIMLASGTTLGDRAAHTIVVHQKVPGNIDDVYEVAQINKYSAPKKTNTKRTVFLCFVILLCVLVLFFSIILIGLSVATKTEEYQVAYNYFVESQAFANSDIDESEIWFNRYYLFTKHELDNNNITETAEIGFTIKGKYYDVICHKKNDVWFVCEECTKFN